MMELPSTPSPSAHVSRRRKKRSTPTSTAPGSSLSALNRSSIRVVELHRGISGYGFTISGQKPCLLRCIVEGSPASRACLRPGNCLVGVNGQDVSHLAHDDVVRLIGSCSGLLRLHIADSYFSESSDDESFQIHQPRPKYPHRPSKGGLSKKHPSHSKLPMVECSSSNNESKQSGKKSTRPLSNRPNENHNLHHESSPKSSRRASWDPLMRIPRPRPFNDDSHPLVPHLPLNTSSMVVNRKTQQQQEQQKIGQEASSSSSSHNHNHNSSMSSVEIVRVFAHLDNHDDDGVIVNGIENNTSSSSNKSVPSIDFVPSNSNNHDTSGRFNTQSSSASSSSRTRNLVRQSCGPCVRSSSSLAVDSPDSSSASSYQAVVGYIGSVELPEIEEKRRLQALSACVRRLRMEKRVRSIVLLRIQSNGVSLFSSSQNVEIGPPLAFYSSNIIAFCGAYSDDRRFFGLVTCTGHMSKSCSCHVFMVEPKLLSHAEHIRRARTFGIVCSSLPVPKNGQVLGLQECAEFPATADPILSSILRLHRPVDEDNNTPMPQQQQQQQQQRSPSEASNRLESTNSSNSDSGIGFRDDSDRTSARIYDIVEPELSLPLPQDLRHFRRSPVPRKRFPISHRKGGNAGHPQQQQPCTSSHMTSNACVPSTSKQQHSSIMVNSASGQSQRTRDHSSSSSSRVSNPSCFFPDDIIMSRSHVDFEPDADSLREILRRDFCESQNSNLKSNGHKGNDGASMDINNIIKLPRRMARERLATPPNSVSNNSSLNSKSGSNNNNNKTTSFSTSSSSNQPRHIEVSVLVTPPRITREKRVSMEHMTPISPSTATTTTNSNSSSSNQSEGNSHPPPLANSSPHLPHRVSLTRNGTRSLDNLCSPEILTQNTFETKGNIGSSTPALNQESGKGDGGGDDFWEFKVPQPPPKPKMEVNRMEKWAESIEKLLADYQGFQLFKEFLEHEFSAENIHFYTACQRFKESYAELTQSQKISMASTIFQRFLQNGATDPVNVDFQARCQVEKALRLSQPTIEMFDLPLGQVFNLLKFDCYPRFLRSDMFRDYASGVNPIPLSVGDPSDSDQDSVKSHKQDGRRRSLLPWNIKNRSKNKHRNKNEGEFHSDLSFIQRTAMNQNFDGSDDQDDDGFRRKSYKLCRVILPDNSTTVLSCKPGESLSTTVQKLLEKRELLYSAFEVLSVATGKPLDLNVDVSEMTAREIKVDIRAFLSIELPVACLIVGVRANPTRRISEVLKPILAQHSLKLDHVLVHDMDNGELVDVKWTMGEVDGHTIRCVVRQEKLKADPKLEEITNQIREFGSYDHAYLDDDQMTTTSTKTTSTNQTNSSNGFHFRGFLRRSSKKYKRKGKTATHSYGGGDTVTDASNEVAPELSRNEVIPVAVSTNKCDVDEENSHPQAQQHSLKLGLSAGDSLNSPLSLLNPELKLQNSRQRKPIYVTQATVESTTKT